MQANRALTRIVQIWRMLFLNGAGAFELGAERDYARFIAGTADNLNHQRQSVLASASSRPRNAVQLDSRGDGE